MRRLALLLAACIASALLYLSLGQVPGEDQVMTPVARVAATPKGALKNPFDGSDPAILAEGHRLFEKAECVGCHGDNAAGRVCPSLVNDVWVYGKDDDTLFRLITMGSLPLQAAGYARKARETKVGPMTGFGEIIPTDRDLWKIIAWLRSVHGRFEPPTN